MTNTEEQERAIDLARSSLEADLAMAARGVPLADFEERDTMAERQTIPCQVVMEDGDRCGRDAPRFGPYAGRCDDHHEEPAPEWDPELLDTLKSAIGPKPPPSERIVIDDVDRELLGDESDQLGGATDIGPMLEMVLAVSEAKRDLDAAELVLRAKLDELIDNVIATRVE